MNNRNLLQSTLVMASLYRNALLAIPIEPPIAATVAFILFTLGFFIPWEYISITLKSPTASTDLLLPVYVLSDPIGQILRGGHCFTFNIHFSTTLGWFQSENWIEVISITSFGTILGYFHKYEALPFKSLWKSAAVHIVILLSYLHIFRSYFDNYMSCEDQTLEVYVHKAMFFTPSILATLFSVFLSAYAWEKKRLLIEDSNR